LAAGELVRIAVHRFVANADLVEQRREAREALPGRAVA
jgi:hypothetical protein